MYRTRLCLTAAAVLFPVIASAQAFTFETVAQGTYTSIVQTSGTQTLTVTTNSPGFLWVQDPNVALLGAISVIGSQNPFLQLNGFMPLKFAFANPVSSITFAFGVNGGDSDTPARFTAFNASNALLGVFDAPYGIGVSSGATNSVIFGGAGASYFVLSSPAGVNNDDSIFWEVTASQEVVMVTPEPTSLVLTVTGLAALFGVARRWRNAT